jgi:hypothetical protein
VVEFSVPIVYDSVNCTALGNKPIIKKVGPIGNDNTKVLFAFYVEKTTTLRIEPLYRALDESLGRGILSGGLQVKTEESSTRIYSKELSWGYSEDDWKTAIIQSVTPSSRLSGRRLEDYAFYILPSIQTQPNSSFYMSTSGKRVNRDVILVLVGDPPYEKMLFRTRFMFRNYNPEGLWNQIYDEDDIDLPVNGRFIIPIKDGVWPGRGYVPREVYLGDLMEKLKTNLANYKDLSIYVFKHGGGYSPVYYSYFSNLAQCYQYFLVDGTPTDLEWINDTGPVVIYKTSEVNWTPPPVSGLV